MPTSLRPTAVHSVPDRWSIPIRMHVASPEPVDLDPTPDRFAHENIFTFVRAMPSDIVRIEAMFRRCSVQSRRLRFFRPVPSAPYGYLEEVLADREMRHVFVIEKDGEPIGLAELHLIGPRSGSLALIVEDQYQRRGVGTAALGLLLCRVRRRVARVEDKALLSSTMPSESVRKLNPSVGPRPPSPLSGGRLQMARVYRRPARARRFSPVSRFYSDGYEPDAARRSSRS